MNTLSIEQIANISVALAEQEPGEFELVWVVYHFDR